MADGGFNVEGEENFQEVKVRQLVMCQFLTALTILKQGIFLLGHVLSGRIGSGTLLQMCLCECF